MIETFRTALSESIHHNSVNVLCTVCIYIFMCHLICDNVQQFATWMLVEIQRINGQSKGPCYTLSVILISGDSVEIEQDLVHGQMTCTLTR